MAYPGAPDSDLSLQQRELYARLGWLVMLRWVAAVGILVASLYGYRFLG
ncbi:hypothetical protein HQ520_17445, partial [bacterium]|nr:hypothetical protein [bacterium]